MKNSGGNASNLTKALFCSRVVSADRGGVSERETRDQMRFSRCQLEDSKNVNPAE